MVHSPLFYGLFTSPFQKDLDVWPQSHSGPCMITMSSCGQVSSPYHGPALWGDLWAEYKCQCALLGKHRSDSEVLMHGEGALSQTLSASVPLG